MSECTEREVWKRELNPPILVNGQMLHLGAFRCVLARREGTCRIERDGASRAMRRGEDLREGARNEESRRGPAASRREGSAAAPLGEPVLRFGGRDKASHRDEQHYRRLDLGIKINFETASQLRIPPR